MELLTLSVLVIDHDPRSATFLENFLTRHGYKVQTSLSAREGYVNALRDRPDIIILDPSRFDMPAVELIRKLRGDKRTSGALMIALALASNPGQMAELLGAGCNEYLQKSQEAPEKILSLLVEYQRSGGLNQPDDLSKKKKNLGGLLIIFMSAKGGSGTSSLCVNIAHNITETNPELDLAVLDLSLPIGSLGPLVGFDGDFDLSLAVSQPLGNLEPDFLRRRLTPQPNWGFRLLAGISDPEIAHNFDTSRIPAVVNVMRRTFDVTMVDLGNSLQASSLPILRDADQIVMITTADWTTATQTKMLWRYLHSKDIARENVYFLLNRAVGLEGLSKSEVEKTLDLSVQATLPYMGGNITQANQQHIPVRKKNSQDTTVLLLDHISRKILDAANLNRN